MYKETEFKSGLKLFVTSPFVTLTYIVYSIEYLLSILVLDTSFCATSDRKLILSIHAVVKQHRQSLIIYQYHVADVIIWRRILPRRDRL